MSGFMPGAGHVNGATLLRECPRYGRCFTSGALPTAQLTKQNPLGRIGDFSVVARPGRGLRFSSRPNQVRAICSKNFLAFSLVADAAGEAETALRILKVNSVGDAAQGCVSLRTGGPCVGNCVHLVRLL